MAAPFIASQAAARVPNAPVPPVTRNASPPAACTGPMQEIEIGCPGTCSAECLCGSVHQVFAMQQRCTWVAAPHMPDLRCQRSSRASLWTPPTSAWRSPCCAASVLLRPAAAAVLNWAPAWATAGCSEADTRSAAHALDAARSLLPWLRVDELGDALNALGV